MKKGVGGTLAMVGEGEGIVYSSYLKLILFMFVRWELKYRLGKCQGVQTFVTRSWVRYKRMNQIIFDFKLAHSERT